MKTFYTGIMVLLAALSGLVAAQPVENPDELQPEHGPAPHIYAQNIIAGKGFALASEGGYHVLGVNVVKNEGIPPGVILKMLREHRSVEEIISALRELQGQSRVRGFMNFAGEHYILNISDATRDSLTATVAVPPSADTGEPSVLGSIALKVEEYEGSRIATGTLEMEGSHYEVLLHVFQGGRKIAPKKVVPQGQHEMGIDHKPWNKRLPSRDAPDRGMTGRGFGPRGPFF